MSYAICKVVCGMEMPGNVRAYLDEFVDSEYEYGGFKILYSAGGEIPAYAGVIIFSFDESKNLRAADLIPRLMASPKQIDEARALMKNAQEYFKETLDNDDQITEKEKQELLASYPIEPEVLLIWSSS